MTGALAIFLLGYFLTFQIVQSQTGKIIMAILLLIVGILLLLGIEIVGVNIR